MYYSLKVEIETALYRVICYIQVPFKADFTVLLKR